MHLTFLKKFSISSKFEIWLPFSFVLSDFLAFAQGGGHPLHCRFVLLGHFCTTPLAYSSYPLQTSMPAQPAWHQLLFFSEFLPFGKTPRCYSQLTFLFTFPFFIQTVHKVINFSPHPHISWFHMLFCTVTLLHSVLGSAIFNVLLLGPWMTAFNSNVIITKLLLFTTDF